MNVPINDDFDKEYKVEAWKGFDLREVAAIGITAGIAAGAACILRFMAGLSLTTSFYISIIPAVPVAALAFFRSRTGQSLPEHLETLRYRKATAKLAWQSMEYEHAWKAYCAAEQKRQKTEEEAASAGEKKWAREAEKLEAMKKAYRKRIRKKVREEARGRKKESTRIKAMDNAMTADVGAPDTDGSAGTEEIRRGISDDKAPFPAENGNTATDSGPEENGNPSGKEPDIPDGADIASFTGPETGNPEADNGDRERIRMLKAQIRSLSAELAKSTREHEARIGKKGG